MKNILILITALLFSLQITYAQTGKGNWSVGITAGTGQNKLTYNYKSFNGTGYIDASGGLKANFVSIGPSFNYFIADKLDINLSPLYSHNAITNTSGDNELKQTSQNIGITFNIRKYLMFDEKLGLRTGPYIGYTRQNLTLNNLTTPSIYDGKKASNTYNAGATLDLLYYPAKKLGLSASVIGLDYSNSRSEKDEQGNYSKSETFNFNFINSSFMLGIFYVFGSK